MEMFCISIAWCLHCSIYQSKVYCPVHLKWEHFIAFKLQLNKLFFFLMYQNTDCIVINIADFEALWVLILPLLLIYCINWANYLTTLKFSLGLLRGLIPYLEQVFNIYYVVLISSASLLFLLCAEHETVEIYQIMRQPYSHFIFK